jgi:hypothetical protein
MIALEIKLYQIISDSAAKQDIETELLQGYQVK